MDLVTGGCGFIGSHLVDLLLAKGHSVRVLDDLSHGSKKYLSKDAHFLQGSITDEATVKRALEGVERIFHLAALVSVPHSVAQWHQSHLINCGGTLRLLESAKQIPLVFASSAAVYGNSSLLPHRETALCCPRSPYGIDKLTCEMHAKIAWELFGTPSVSCRFFNVYGPRQNPTSSYSGVISKFATSLARREPLTIYGDGDQRRDFIFVQDVVFMLYEVMRSLTAGAHVYNFCTGKTYSINQLAELMMQISGIEVEKLYLPNRLGEIFASQGDPAHALEKARIKTRFSLGEGLGHYLQRLFADSDSQCL